MPCTKKESGHARLAITLCLLMARSFVTLGKTRKYNSTAAIHKPILYARNNAMRYIIINSEMRVRIYQCERNECELLQTSLMHFDVMRMHYSALV